MAWKHDVADKHLISVEVRASRPSASPAHT
jgi:hypothetical protein